MLEHQKKLKSTSPKKISFGIIADVQYCDATPVKNRFFREAKDKLVAAIALLNRLKPDFVINLGDMIDRDWQSFDSILPVFDQLQMPVHHVLGNHDYEVAEALKSMVPGRMGMGTKRYYDFQVSGWRFVVLDGNDISTFAHATGSPKHKLAEECLRASQQKKSINANFWNGAIGKTQLTWLNGVLLKAQKSLEPVVICCHYPIFPSDRHNLLNDSELLHLLQPYKNIKAWICGHNHQGNYGQYQNIHFINMKGMVETSHEAPLAFATLEKNLISIKGFGGERSFRLAF
ncbi:MAG: hypothetical protein HC819_14425 [Cyclobacteriaceae bacterium]|nr:hypothetical protein [Cyclobacteriaceae bacterium]